MAAYFDRLRAAWEAAGRGLPRVPRDPDADERLWVGAPDESDWVAWQPLRKGEVHDLDAVAPDLLPLHPCFHAYFNSWWFAALEGRIGRHGVTLLPVMPGIELEAFLHQARGYAEQHHGRRDHLPIGVEFDGLLVVVDNRSGEVSIEDWERNTHEPIAPGLPALIDGLEP